jgi:hypothetical protein
MNTTPINMRSRSAQTAEKIDFIIISQLKCHRNKPIQAVALFLHEDMRS